MPTGYTSFIEEGISFRDFTMKCSRNSDHLIKMRDELLTADIPDKFEPSEYHTKKIGEITEEIVQVNKLTLQDANKKAKQEYDDAVKYRKESAQTKRKLLEKYSDMLHQSKNWTPPTEDHQGLKDFMVSHIEGSIKLDCDFDYPEPKKRMSAENWLEDKKQRLRKDLSYHIKEHTKEVDRTNSSNKWLQQLRESIK